MTVDGDPAYDVIDEGYNNQGYLNDESIYSNPEDRSFPILTVPGWNIETMSAGDEFRAVTAHTELEDRDLSATPPGEAQYEVKYNDDPDTNNFQVDGDYISDDSVKPQLGQTLRVVWESGDQSQTLLEEEIK